MFFKLLYAPTTQFTDSYRCREKGGIICEEGCLYFLCTPYEDQKPVYSPELCSLSKEAIKRIPIGLRSKKMAPWYTKAAKNRINIHQGKAQFEHREHKEGGNRYQVSSRRDDVGEFIFSVTRRVARSYLPKSYRYLVNKQRGDSRSPVF